MSNPRMPFKFPTEAQTGELIGALDAAGVDKELSEAARMLTQTAATKLREYQSLAVRAADQLDQCGSVRIGQMDSESRANEKYQSVKNILMVLSAEFRAIA